MISEAHRLPSDKAVELIPTSIMFSESGAQMPLAVARAYLSLVGATLQIVANHAGCETLVQDNADEILSMRGCIFVNHL